MSGRADMVFVAPPHAWNEPVRLDIKPPLNLIYLASYVQAQGLATAILDPSSCEQALADVVAAVVARGPRWVGVPFYQGTHDSALELCRALRVAMPDVVLVGGGPLMTCRPDMLVSSGDLDVGIIGEGEAVLWNVLQRRPGDWADLPGTCTLQDGRAVTTDRPAPLASLDELPFLDYSLVDMDLHFAKQDELGVPRSFFMTSSRGCAFKCTYCATPVLWPGRVRRYSVERVLAEIDWQQGRMPADTSVAFLDDSFFARKGWLRSFFAGIGERATSYACIGRADHLTAEDVAELRRTGCIYVSMGVETGVAARQAVLKKHLDLDRVREAVRLLAGAGIFCKCFFMVGFPDETLADMAATIDFAVELRRSGMDECIFFPLILYAGTELARGYEAEMWQARIHAAAAERSGASYAEGRLERYSSIPAVDVNPYLNHEQLVELIKVAYGKVQRLEATTVAELEALRASTAGSTTGTR